VATERTDNTDTNVFHFLKDLSWADLKSANNRAALAPFQLPLSDCKDVFLCTEIVRVIPGKRVVAFGTLGDKHVVAKLFFEHQHAQRHAKRDAGGIKALLESGVLTPALHYQGTSIDKRVQVLIFERIKDCVSVDVLWQNRSSIKELLPLMHSMTIELATHHVLGIMQRDLHFKNFLVKHDHIYTIDGGDLEIFDRPLSKKESLENLGLFFSQLGAGSDALQKTLFMTYVEARGWIVKKNDIADLNAAVENWTQRRWESYSKKILRTCTAFVRQQNINSVTMYDRDYESTAFLEFLKNPESIFSAPDTEMLKAGRSATVVKVKIDDTYFVMKRYNIKDTAHRMRRCLRPTRAAKGWCLAQRLRLMGVATAKPAAFIEKRFAGLRGKSYLLMEYIDGVHAGEYFSEHQQADNNSLFIAQQMMMLFENLARLRITHGDLKMTNILITTQQRPMLIDLDGMREHHTVAGFKRTFHQEIKRFMVNWHDNPTVYEMFELLVEEIYRRLGVGKDVAVEV
jgi:tRNA A-37 threonylcarbamoyl transferase component Bud32